MRTFMEFMGQCASACDEAMDEQAILMIDHPNDPELVGCLAISDEWPAEKIKEMVGPLPGAHRYIAMATKIGWAPDQVQKTAETWCLIVVGRDQPAELGMRRIVEDDEWHHVNFVLNAPWFATSTAAAIRKILDGDFSAPFKRAGAEADPRLFEPMTRSNPPRTDKQGRI